MRNIDLIITPDTILTCHDKRGFKAGKDMGDAGVLRGYGIAVYNGIIIDIDKIENLRARCNAPVRNFKGKTIIPGFVDSHTHPIFAGSRVSEFEARLRGATYEEIHASGGGIQSTVNATRNAPFDELYKNAKFYIHTMMKHGTTTVEAKSGYGLSSVDEIKSLKVLKKLQKDLPVDIIATFMGAHSIPKEHKENRLAYVRLLIDEMLPKIKKENLAAIVDVFCEEGAFTFTETKKIFASAKKLGFQLKVHADEFKNLGASSLIAKLKGLSADHLMNINSSDIKMLAKNKTAATLLPGTTFFLNKDKYAPAREIIDGNVITALATDFNAGSCQTLSMQMIISLAVLKMKMTVEEALNAATINGAYALGLSGKIGSIAKGKQADFCILGVSDYRQMPYYFGTNLVERVIKKGRIVV